MAVQIPEQLLFDMVQLLTEPKALIPAEGTCVLSIEARDRVLNDLLQVQRNFLFSTAAPPRPYSPS